MKRTRGETGGPPDLEERRAWALAAIAVPLLLLAPMFLRSGPLLCLDQPMWATVASELKNEVVPQTGWFWGIQVPRANAGQDLGTQWSTHLVVLWALAHVVSAALAVKLACLVSVLVYSTGLYRLCARIAPRAAAALATALGVIPAIRLSVDGMSYNLLALGLALWCWLALDRFLRSGRARDWLLAVALFALTVYTHPLGGIVLTLVWSVLLLLALRRPRPGGWRRVLALGAVPAIALLLAAPQVLAVLDASGGVTTVWEPGFSARRILRRLLGGHGLHPVVRVGFLAVALLGAATSRRIDGRIRWPLVPVLLVCVALSVESARLLPGGFPLRQGWINFAYRFAYVLDLVYSILFAIGFGALMRHARRAEGRPRTALRAALAFVVLASAAQVAHAQRHEWRSQQTLGSVANREELAELWTWLEDDRDPDAGRVFFEDTRFLYPIRPHGAAPAPWARGHVQALAGLGSPILQVSGWSVPPTEFGSIYCWDGGRIFGTVDPTAETPRTVDANLRRLDCTHLVVHSERVKEQVEAMPFLRRVARIGCFDVYRHEEMTPRRAGPASDPDRRFPVEVRRGGQEYVIDAEGAAGETIHVSVAANPRWRAYAGEREIPVGSDRALVTLRLPETGPVRIRLAYEIPKAGALAGVGLGLLGLLAGVLVLRRRPAAAAA